MTSTVQRFEPEPVTATSTTEAFGATAFDRTVPRLSVPGVLTGGTQPELQLVDGFTRGDRVVGRFETSPGLLAVKVAPPGGPVHVTVKLAADADTVSWWEQRVPEHVEPRTPHGARLLAIRSQGKTRGAVLLARRAEDFSLRTRARLSFELTEDELPADGFLIVEAVDVDAAAPAWAERRATHAAVGVRVDAVEVGPVTAGATPAFRPGTTLDGTACERLGLIGTGGPSGHAAAVDVRAGFFVALPGPGIGGPVTWTLRPRLVGDVQPDPIPPEEEPVIPKPMPGQPPLTTREKATAVARHELGSLSAQVRRTVRHTTVRGLRRATRPVDDGRAPRVCGDLAARGLVVATVVALDSGERRPCVVAPAAGGRVTVTCADPPSGPAVVHVRALTSGGPLARATSGRMHWRLVSATYGAP